MCLLLEGPLGFTPPNVFAIARKLVKCWPCCRRVGHSAFHDLFLVVVVGQVVRMPPPLNGKKVSRHISDLASIIRFAEGQPKAAIQCPEQNFSWRGFYKFQSINFKR